MNSDKKFFGVKMCLVEKFKLNCSYLIISPNELSFGVMDCQNYITCLCDLNYVNICMIIYLHVLYNCIGIGIMHSICTVAP